MDDEGTEGKPVDVSWDEKEFGDPGLEDADDETEASPHEGEEGQAGDVA